MTPRSSARLSRNHRERRARVSPGHSAGQHLEPDSPPMPRTPRATFPLPGTRVVIPVSACRPSSEARSRRKSDNRFLRHKRAIMSRDLTLTRAQTCQRDIMTDLHDRLICPSLTASRPYRRLHARVRSEEHTSELQSRSDLVCRLLLEKKKKPA